MRIYNTMSRSLEEFETVEPGKVRMYVCGVTPYSAAHVGHAMSYLLFDAIRRYLEYRQYEVKHVQNYTDIDDKIIARAELEGIEPDALAQRQIDEFAADLLALNILPATVYPRATQEVPAIIALIERLIERGYAYEAHGDVYFRVTHLDDYGKLSHRNLDEMLAGARIEVDTSKENPADFAVWKAAKPGEPMWPSPWGPGRPGWHIECSAMSLRYLGEQIDIHGGGQDLIFPHHENEIAQTEAATGVKPFVRYWLHNGLLQFGAEKMSKSVGNLVTIREAIDQYGADGLRLFVLTSHYRNPLTYSDEGLAAAQKGVQRLTAALQPTAANPVENASATVALAEAVARTRLRFIESMDDDFNTPAAVASLFDLVRELNRGREAGGSEEALARARETLGELAGVLGFQLKPDADQQEQSAAPFIDLLVQLRQELRTAKQWALADQVRDDLQQLGIIIEDRPGGSSWKRAN